MQYCTLVYRRGNYTASIWVWGFEDCVGGGGGRKTEQRKSPMLLDSVRKKCVPRSKINRKHVLGSFHPSRCSSSDANPPTLITKMRGQDTANKINQQTGKTGGWQQPGQGFPKFGSPHQSKSVFSNNLYKNHPNIPLIICTPPPQ